MGLKDSLYKGMFSLISHNQEKEELLELQKLVLGNSPDRLIMSKEKLIATAKCAAQRDLEIIQDCVRIISETKKPDTFFSRLNLLISKVENLRIYEKHLKFSGSPSAAYGQIWEQHQECIGQFLVRYFSDVLDQAEKLKTDKGQRNKYQKFYDSLQPYYDQMDASNIDYIETKYRAYTRSLKA